MNQHQITLEVFVHNFWVNTKFTKIIYCVCKFDNYKNIISLFKMCIHLLLLFTIVWNNIYVNTYIYIFLNIQRNYWIFVQTHQKAHTNGFERNSPASLRWMSIPNSISRSPEAPPISAYRRKAIQMSALLVQLQ